MSDQPGPSADERKRGVAELFGKLAPAYDTVIPYFATLGRALVGAAGLQPGDRVLDVASGRGAVLLAALEAVRPGGSVLGIDLTPGMVAELDAVVGGLPDAEVRVGDAESPGVPDGSFDAVTCGFGIFFLPDASAALRAWQRALRPGGTLALSTFVGSGGWSWFQEIANAIKPETATRPTLDHPLLRSPAVREALTGLGFTGVRTVDISQRYVFPDPDTALGWYSTHGWLRFVESLDAAQQEELRRQFTERLAAHRVPGGYELIQGAEATVATAP